jgi:hypothetical protein
VIFLPSDLKRATPRCAADHAECARADFAERQQRRWRTDLVGILSDHNALIRPRREVLAEQHDEWLEGRRYLGLEVLKRARPDYTPSTPPRPRMCPPATFRH